MPSNFSTNALASSSFRRTPTSAEIRRANLYRDLSLWVLQAWLALFYIGAGYAKLSQPQELLALLMTWPGQVDASRLHAVGWVEITLAASVVTPLISWRLFRPILLTGALGLLADAVFMMVFHALERDPGLTVVNGLLVVMTLAVIVGRWPGKSQTPGSRSDDR